MNDTKENNQKRLRDRYQEELKKDAGLSPEIPESKRRFSNQLPSGWNKMNKKRMTGALSKKANKTKYRQPCAICGDYRRFQGNCFSWRIHPKGESNGHS